MGGEEDVEELYADLYEHVGDGRQVPKTSLLEMEERMNQLTKQGEEMHLKIQTLQKQNNSLQEEKDILICNISSLFKTAQMEIGRKNKQINELRQEISQLKIQEPSSNSLIPTTVQIIAKSEKLSHDKQLYEVQNKSDREIRRVGEMQEIARISPNDSNAMKNRSRDETTPSTRSVTSNTIERTVQFVNVNGTQNKNSQARASEHVNGTQNKNSLKGQYVNGKEGCSFGRDRLKGSHSREKLVEPKIDGRNDQQRMHTQKKDRVRQNSIRDCSCLGSMEKNADKTILGNSTMKSIGDCDILGGDGNCIGPRNSGLLRKVIDADDTGTVDSYSEDPSTCRIQKSDSFVHSRNGKNRSRSEDNEQSGARKLLGKQYKNDSGEDENFGKVQVRNGFESGQDHETRSWMNEARLPEHGNKAHLSENTGPERLSFISDEPHEDCREEVQTNGEQRRKRSRDSELPEIMGADKGDFWPCNAGTYSSEVSHERPDDSLQNRTVINSCEVSHELPKDSLQNTTVIKGQGMRENSINSSISFPEVNHTDGTVYSFANGDDAEAGFNLQLGVDETSEDFGMSRELNVEMPKESDAISYRAEEVKDGSQGHRGESISEEAIKFRVSPDIGREKQDSKNTLQHEKEVKFEKKERCSDFSFSRERGIEETKDTHTDKDNDSWQGKGNISNDYGRKNCSFSSGMNKQGRRGHAHQVQARNGFESGQDHETRSWMNKARVPKHGNKARLSETTGPERLSFISVETHEDSREQRRKTSKDSKLPEIMGAADKGDIWSSNAGTYSCEVSHVLLDDNMQNSTAIKGEGMETNTIKSSISLTGVNHTDSTVYSFVSGDGADTGLKLQLVVDETPKDLGMPRELSVEMPKEVEEMKDSSQRHRGESISEKARKFRDCSDRSREKRDSKNNLQHGKEVTYEKKESCSDLSFSRKRGIKEMKDTHTNKGNDSRQGNGNISSDHGRKNSSFSFDMNKQRRKARTHQVQARNGFESGQYHEARSWMNETSVPEHGNKAHLSESTGPERLAFISDETYEDCREEVHTTGEQRRKRSKDSELPEIRGKDKGDIWSSNAGTYSSEVGHVLLDDILQNNTVIKGQGIQANNIKSSISLPEVNHTDSTVYSFVNGDGAEAGFNLQLGVDETPKAFGMPRELNVEIPKEAGATNHRAEEMKDSSQSHRGESISDRARRVRVSPDRSREKQDSKNILQHGKQGNYEKKERCSDLSFSRKRGIKEMKDRHTNQDNYSRQGKCNISNDDGRINSSFSSDIIKQGRGGHTHQVIDLRKSSGDKFDHRRQHTINGERIKIQFSCADGARDEAMTEQHHAYSECRRGGRDFLHKQEKLKSTSRSEHHTYGAERDKYKRRDRCGD